MMGNSPHIILSLLPPPAGSAVPKRSAMGRWVGRETLEGKEDLISPPICKPPTRSLHKYKERKGTGRLLIELIIFNNIEQLSLNWRIGIHQPGKHYPCPLKGWGDDGKLIASITLTDIRGL